MLVQDPKKELRTFRLALTGPPGTKRGRGREAAIDSVLAAVDTYYGEVLQHLKTRTATPPKMREPAEAPVDMAPALLSTALSSQDGVEAVDAPTLGEPAVLTDVVAEDSVEKRVGEECPATPGHEPSW